MIKLLLLSLFCAIVSIEGLGGESDLDKVISNQLERRNGTSLSRKRRFLVFPAGSSFQLVFCLTYPSLGMGSLYVFGHTAALAWELPSTPLFYSHKDFEKKEEVETTTSPHIPHDIDFSALDHHFHDRQDTWNPPNLKLNTFGRPAVSSYNNPFQDLVHNYGFNSVQSLNPEFRGNDEWGRRNGWQQAGRIYYGQKQNGNGFQRSQIGDPYQSAHIDPVYYPVHRRSRRDLYRKMENFLTALNLDGKVCLLKAICEVNKSPKEKGTFMVEIFKAVFSVKPHENYPNEDHYDHAANPSHDCDQMYPGCKGSIWTNLFLFQK